MNHRHWISTAFGVALLCSMPGCASVVSGRHADVTFYSNVPNAHVAIRDQHGKQVAVTEAGNTVALKRKDKWVFPAKYTATVESPGYQPAEVPIDAKINPWVLGNVAFLHLGLVGLAVDNVTGAAWMPDESAYYQELTPMSGPALYGQSPYGAAPYGLAGQPQQSLVGQTPGLPTQFGVPASQVATSPPMFGTSPTAAAPSTAPSEPIVQTAAATGTQPVETMYR